jgi:cytidyltransferase-like protein
MKIAIISGGFDPIHVGHIELMEKAKSIADSLVVIVNDDDFLTRKKGKPFMPLKERIKIVRSIKYVDMAIKSVDKDQTVCESLKGLASCKTSNEKLLFCNGGDRTSGENTPEHALCLELGIETVYGLGDKIQSSSWLTN